MGAELTGYDTYIEDFIDEHGYLFCERCGESGHYYYERHHIFYRSEKPKHPNLNHKDNIILVCERCHKELHSCKDLRYKLGRLWQLAKNLFIKK